MNPFITTLFIIFALAVAQSAADSQPPANNFLVQAKVIIDGKPYNPTNLSLFIAGDSSPSYSFNLSAPNFNKNVTVALRLFSWYNADWVLSRQTISLRITDRRNVYRQSSHLLARLLKYNSRRYEARMTDEKEQTLLNYTQVLVSYDPESSLLVSRLEDPEIFNQQQSYLPLSDMSKETKSKSMKINITFAVVTRSDTFVNSKNHIVSLNQIAGKVRQRIPLISRPNGDNIEPILLYKTILFNYEAIKKANKLYNQRTALMESKNYGGLLVPRLHRLPFSLPASIHSVASAVNVSLTDSFVPTYYFALQQGFILDTISQLQDFVRKNLNGWGDRDLMAFVSQWAQIEAIVSFVVAALWVFLDFNGFRGIKTHAGLSWSYGYFLVAWLLFQIISFSLRVGATIHPYWGIGVFFLSLVLLKLAISPLDKRFKSHPHKQSSFDKGVTELCFNLLVLGVLANGVLHLYVDKDIKAGELIFWAISEFQLLLSEYYYFLVMLPPLLLSFKLKTTSHLRFRRLLLFFVVAFKDDYWLLIDNSHWSLIILRLKEQILFALILVLKAIYGNGPIEFIQPEPQKVKTVAETLEEQSSSSQLNAQQEENVREKTD